MYCDETLIRSPQGEPTLERADTRRSQSHTSLGRGILFIKPPISLTGSGISRPANSSAFKSFNRSSRRLDAAAVKEGSGSLGSQLVDCFPRSPSPQSEVHLQPPEGRVGLAKGDASPIHPFVRRYGKGSGRTPP